MFGKPHHARYAAAAASLARGPRLSVNGRRDGAEVLAPLAAERQPLVLRGLAPGEVPPELVARVAVAQHAHRGRGVAGYKLHLMKAKA
jgi:hypothetical protein